MVDRLLIQSLEGDTLQADPLMRAAGLAVQEMGRAGGKQGGEFSPGSVLKGRVVGIAGDDVVVDVGFKSEGLVHKNEFDNFDQIKPGDTIEVMLEAVEAADGLVQLSKRKADRVRSWERITQEKKEGDNVEGKVTRRIKGGLLVDVGVPVFLPASQVDIRRPADIGMYLGQTVRAQIIKIDTERRNIVISRRKLLEEERASARQNLMTTIKEGDRIKGVVKNIADFGAFVDIGGLDGLLHITDMSWNRLNHPSDMVQINQNIEVVVLTIDKEKEKIALGLKQITPNPWTSMADLYPVTSKMTGTVVNIVPYGAFVKLGDGIEGLVHISEMSWTRRVNHPSEVVSVGQEVQVVILEVNTEKQEISLGMKQAETNPWDLVAQKYSPGTIVEGALRNLTNYGAFVEVEPGVDGMLHVSDLSWTKKVAHPNELLKKGQTVKCVVLEVDQANQRISLGVKQLTQDPWLEAIPTHYQPGMVVTGKVTKITNFGVFVELEEGLEGLLHVSELADHKVEDPNEVVKVAQEIEVKILRVDVAERKIGLSLRRAQTGEGEAAAQTPSPSSPPAADKPDRPRATRGGMDDRDELGTDKISFGPGGARAD